MIQIMSNLQTNCLRSHLSVETSDFSYVYVLGDM